MFSVFALTWNNENRCSTIGPVRCALSMSTRSNGLTVGGDFGRSAGPEQNGALDTKARAAQNKWAYSSGWCTER